MKKKILLIAVALLLVAGGFAGWKILSNGAEEARIIAMQRERDAAYAIEVAQKTAIAAANSAPPTLPPIPTEPQPRASAAPTPSEGDPRTTTDAAGTITTRNVWSREENTIPFDPSHNMMGGGKGKITTDANGNYSADPASLPPLPTAAPAPEPEASPAVPPNETDQGAR